MMDRPPPPPPPVERSDPVSPIHLISVPAESLHLCCSGTHMSTSMSYDEETFVEQVRNWGETHHRTNQESSQQHLTLPRRQSYNAGTFQSRIHSSLIIKPPKIDEKTDVQPKTATPPTSPSRDPKKELVRVSSYKERCSANIRSSKKTVQLSVLPLGPGNSTTTIQELRANYSVTGVVHGTFSTIPLTPLNLLDIENGISVLVTNHKKSFMDAPQLEEFGEDGAVIVTAKATGPIPKEDTLFYQERGESWQSKINTGIVPKFDTDKEFGIIGGMWRGILRRLLLWAIDDINAVRMGRQLQLVLPFLAVYESYLLSQVMEVMDIWSRKLDVSYVLKLAFQNRNVARILAEEVGARWNFAWQDHYYKQATSRRIWNGLSQSSADPSVVTHSLQSPVKNFGNTYSPFEERLPTDESIVRTFVQNPFLAMSTYGVVPTLRQLAKHWHDILYQSSGNFTHHRMEQLDPFETMRVHMPIVCLVLCSQRGRTQWDATILSLFVRKCQELKPSFGADGCRYLAREMQQTIVANLTAGVASVYDPLHSWLTAIVQSCDLIEEEAKEVYQKVTSVEVGLRLGHDIISQMSWKTPSENDLKNAILMYIKVKNPGLHVSERRMQSALALTTPRDKRTLIDLVKRGFEKSKPAQLLLNRVKNLLQRDIRRDAFNEAIRELSVGEYVTDLVPDEWYWLEEGSKRAIYIYLGEANEQYGQRFMHIDSGKERVVSLNDGYIKSRVYIPVAESISRAQRCYMNIELEHGKKFSYSAFMEFSFLRVALRRLVVVSQIFCEELNHGRLNILREVQRATKSYVDIHEMEVGRTYYTFNSEAGNYETFLCKKQYSHLEPEWEILSQMHFFKVPPQSMIVLGGGPAGLLTAIHCTENVLISGGEMQLYEARDAIGETAERAEILRLDARWISMLRYHLGTAFEDIYIPASGLSDAQLGNVLPQEGFVEVSRKDLESALHVEMSRMWSIGAIQYLPDSGVRYSMEHNALVKKGMHLKLNDGILRNINPDGEQTDQLYVWKVTDLIYMEPLGLDELIVGHEYGLFIEAQDSVLPFKFVGVDLQSRIYTFNSLKKGVTDLPVIAAAHNLPSVYPKGTLRHAEICRIVVTCARQGYNGELAQEELLMNDIQSLNFRMDTGHTHIVQCEGHPDVSPGHLHITSDEPYGVCCIQGLKISMGLHDFGEKRCGNSLISELRSANGQNIRVFQDSSFMLHQPLVAEQMLELIKTNKWQQHFVNVLTDLKISSLDQHASIVRNLRKAVTWHALNANSFQRQTLQTQLLETRDSFHLSMELTREYDRWKHETADSLLNDLMAGDVEKDEAMEHDKVQVALMHHIDRLWFESCFEVIRTNNIYLSSSGQGIPKLYTIDDSNETRLSNLSVGESFRLLDHPDERYEVLMKQSKIIVVRNVEGFIARMERKTMVRRAGNLTRGADGNTESQLSLATFPVGHCVNHRTVRLHNESEGYVYASMGDEQITPRFMRYGALTGACINAMLFNDFIKQTIDGVSLMERLARLATERDWCNSEVVARGTGSLFGRNSFLRPGCNYKNDVDYLHCKVIEGMETGQNIGDILSRDWKVKFAASLVPRGLELNGDFIRVLYQQARELIFANLLDDVTKDKFLAAESLLEILLAHREQMKNVQFDWNYQSYWTQFVVTLEGVDDSIRERLRVYHVEIAMRTEQSVVQIVEFATKGYLYNERLVAEVCRLPSSLGKMVDVFDTDAKQVANSLLLCAAFSAGALAFVLFDFRKNEGSNVGPIFGSLLAGLNIIVSFHTMILASRYKKRNEEARVFFFENKFMGVLQASFACMSSEDQNAVPEKENPFVIDLRNVVDQFKEQVSYYGLEDPDETGFTEVYNRLRQNVNDPGAIREFQTKLSTEFIAVVYHENSHVQECLVNIYKSCANMLRRLEQDENPHYSSSTEHLFRRLSNFSPRLGKSLHYGSLGPWHMFLVFRYFWSLVCCATKWGANPLAPIQTEILGIHREACRVSSYYENKILRREIRDLDFLYKATCESDVASTICLVAFLVHVISWLFSISRILSLVDGPSVVVDIATWAIVAATFSGILAALHFQQKFLILQHLHCILGGKVRTAMTADDKANVQKVKAITHAQIMLTLLRLGAACGASVCLPWSMVLYEFPDRAVIAEEILFWIALGTVCAAILSMILPFVIHSSYCYNLSPKLGEYVCEAFRGEIEAIHDAVSVPLNDIETKQDQEQECWEYVARDFIQQYRWTAVFDANRLNLIVQYIHSGMDPRAG